MLYTVLGGAGFIGCHLVNHLRNIGHQVYAPDRSQLDSVYRRALGNVIYCIGLTSDFRTKPFETVRAHISTLTDILEKAQFDSFLYLSSTRVYENSTITSETNTLNVDSSDPSDFYNLSKLMGEAICKSCKNAKVARLSNVVGPDPGPNNFFGSILQGAINGKIVLETSLRSEKDYIWVNDVITILPQICTNGKQFIYNVASGSNLTHRALVNRLMEQTGCTLETSTNAPTVAFPVIDVNRVRSEFDFRPGLVLDNLELILRERIRMKQAL